MTGVRVDVAYSAAYLDWQLGAGHPTNPQRARLAVELLEADGVPMQIVAPRAATLDELQSVHDPAYVAEALAGRTGEWEGDRPDLGAVAGVMFGGTAVLVDRMLDGTTTLGFNPQGAKHHARFAAAAGFCVFNDMAYAARRFTDAGLRVLYLDWDAHHGDDVEELTADNPMVMTASIHNVPLFPGTGLAHDSDLHVYNYPLRGRASGAAMLAAVEDALVRVADFRPDVVLLAAGADGHVTDPLSALTYELADFAAAAEKVAQFADEHCATRILVGGASGYQPQTWTPRIWATVVGHLSRPLQHAPTTESRISA